MEGGGAAPGAVRVKMEPAGHEHERACCPEEDKAAHMKEEVVVVKQELYTDHVVWEGLVLGPVCLQKRAGRSETEATVQPEPGAAAKEEPECWSETAGSCGSERQQQTQHSERQSWPTLSIKPIGGSWCHVCSKQFKIPSRLKEHMRVHTGEKPYPCKTCEKRFARRSILTVHERTHTAEKRFCCEICNISFTFARSLREHTLLHMFTNPIV